MHRLIRMNGQDPGLQRFDGLLGGKQGPPEQVGYLAPKGVHSNRVKPVKIIFTVAEKLIKTTPNEFLVVPNYVVYRGSRDILLIVL